MKINSFFSFIISFILFKLIIPVDYLNKYESIEVDGFYTDFIIFYSSGFSKSDTIYFKLTSKAKCFNFLGFSFEDTIDTYNPTKYTDYPEFTATPASMFNELIEGENYTIYYYNIKKIDYYLDNKRGDYLILRFSCGAKVKIENTRFDLSSGISEGALIAIYVSVTAVFIIVAVIIICYCYKKRKARLERENLVYNANMRYQNANTNPQQMAPISAIAPIQSRNIGNPMLMNNVGEIQVVNNNLINTGGSPMTSASNVAMKRLSVAKPNKRRKSVKK